MKNNQNVILNFLYKTIIGRIILKLLIRAFFSKLAGLILDSSISKIFIKGFIKRNNIDMNEYRKVNYRSFNDFFTREVEYGYRSFTNNYNNLPSPCDGKLSAYQINYDSVFKIKNSVYDINDMLLDNELAEEFINGTCLIFRLTPDDYHRYCFIDDGVILSHKIISGVFHTVQPIVHERYKVFSKNSREYTVMQTKNFDKVIQMEVGALFVGKISNRIIDGSFVRAEAKGMFEFGGSTIILLFKKNTVLVDENIYKNTLADKETVVKLGEKIGIKMLDKQT